MGAGEKMQAHCALGVDVGSTTVKCVLTKDGEIVFQDYRRHLSRVRQTTLQMLREIEAQFPTARVSAVL